MSGRMESAQIIFGQPNSVPKKSSSQCRPPEIINILQKKKARTLRLKQHNFSFAPNNMNFLQIQNQVKQHNVVQNSQQQVATLRTALNRNWLQNFLETSPVQKSLGGGFMSQPFQSQRTQSILNEQRILVPSEKPTYSNKIEEQEFVSDTQTDKSSRKYKQKINLAPNSSQCLQESSNENNKLFFPLSTINTSEKATSSIKVHRRIFAQPMQRTLIHKRSEPSKSQDTQQQQQIIQQQEAKRIIIEKSMLQFISAKNFVIICQLSENIVFSRKCHKQREVASLTKIMTCYTACRLINELNIEPKELILPVSRKAALNLGTTANLRVGDQFTLLDLLYGMMLPSGNDAAFAVAEGLGRYLKKISNEQSNSELNSNQAVKLYLTQMNKVCQDIQLKDTNYANPHGLANTQNFSSAYDQAIITLEAMRNPLFAQIVGTLNYKCTVNNIRTQTTREISWENTNKLLSRKDCLGVKTGFTPIAGSCLAANFHSSTHQLIIVLLKASGNEERFTEMIHLYEYTKRKLTI